MKKYNILLEETLARIVQVVAKDENEARTKVEKMYNNEEIVLTGEDFSNVEFLDYENN